MRRVLCGAVSGVLGLLAAVGESVVDPVITGMWHPRVTATVFLGVALGTMAVFSRLRVLPPPYGNHASLFRSDNDERGTPDVERRVKKDLG